MTGQGRTEDIAEAWLEAHAERNLRVAAADRLGCSGRCLPDEDARDLCPLAEVLDAIGLYTPPEPEPAVQPDESGHGDRYCKSCQTTKPAAAFDRRYKTCRTCLEKAKGRRSREPGASRAPARTDGLKECSKCRQVKPLAKFWVDGRATDGRRSDCAACCKARNAAKAARR